MFILLKILLFFFRPLTWIIILVLFAFLTKNAKRKRIAITSAFALLLFFTNPFIISSLIRAHEAKPVTLQQDHFSTGILLGGFVGYHKKENRGYFNEASDRLLQTALLYKRNQIKKILVSAGNGYLVKHSFVEAEFARQHLIDLGIPAADIIAEGRSRNTEENALYSKRIIDSLALRPPFLLITSAFHIPRAQLAFKNAGIDADAYPCHFIGKQVSNNFFEDHILPNSNALRMWDNYIKELVGIAVYQLKN